MNEEEVKRLQKERSSQQLANASYVLGILSLFSVFCCCPFVISAIGITLALLSKGASEIMKPKAKTGMIMSIIGLFTSLAIILSTIVMPIVLAKLNPEIGENFKKQYREVLEQNEDYYKGLYGEETYDTLQDIIDSF